MPAAPLHSLCDLHDDPILTQDSVRLHPFSTPRRPELNRKEVGLESLAFLRHHLTGSLETNSHTSTGSAGQRVLRDILAQGLTCSSAYHACQSTSSSTYSLSKMSIARAFTTRRQQKPEMHITSPMHIGRAATQRGGRPVNRSQISAPKVLLSTSNVQLNNAEHIAGASPIENRSFSSGSSVMSSSAEDSDGSSRGNASVHSNDTITDASSVDESPMRTEPEPNHLSCYFKPAVDTHARSPSQSPSHSARPSLETPSIPQREPSHSKKAHETLHRKRSVQRMFSPPPTAREHRRSPTQESFVEAPKEGPFGRELAQLDEVAEEFGHVVRDAETEADLASMKKHDLAYYAASDYLSEIQSMIYSTFEGEPTGGPAGWI
ncbi:hypothetical protein D0869_06555 [Hortaea werneckii]|uniref:Uncharacterized protein n=2 Tax=Hortaea werneckii TaxID=91943 RepID=A0A3M6WTK0_HORWE|nr:hypothetical protein D0869_06555 [Hortaea werneckii]